MEPCRIYPHTRNTTTQSRSFSIKPERWDSISKRRIKSFISLHHYRVSYSNNQRRGFIESVRINRVSITILFAEGRLKKRFIKRYRYAVTTRTSYSKVRRKMKTVTINGKDYKVKKNSIADVATSPKTYIVLLVGILIGLSF